MLDYRELEKWNNEMPGNWEIRKWDGNGNVGIMEDWKIPPEAH